MIERHADTLTVKAPMLVENATSLLAAGCKLFSERVETIDLSAVTAADSSALAVMLGWVRSAETAGHALKFINLPKSIQALAKLYGIDELLPLA